MKGSVGSGEVILPPTTTLARAVLAAFDFWRATLTKLSVGDESVVYFSFIVL